MTAPSPAMPAPSAPSISSSELLGGALRLLPRVGVPGLVLLVGSRLFPFVAAHLVLHAGRHSLLVVQLIIVAGALAVGLAAGMVFHLAGSALEGTERPSVAAAFRATKGRLLSVSWAYFMVCGIASAGTLLLVVPGILGYLTLSLSVPVALHEGAKTKVAFAASQTRTRGHRRAAFGAYAVVTVPWVACFIATIAIGMIWVHDHHRYHHPLPPMPIHVWLARAGLVTASAAFELLPILVSAVLYARTLPAPEDAAADEAPAEVEAPAPATPVEELPPEPCDRCGAFAALYTRGEGRYCATCLARLTHPIERGGVTVGSLLSAVLRLTRTVGPKVLLLGLCVYGALEVLGWRFPAHHRLMEVVAPVVSILLDAVVLALAIDSVLAEDQSSMTRALARTGRRAGPLLLALFLAFLVDALAAVFLIVPGILCMVSFSVVVPMALFERRSAPDTLRESWSRMKGHRLTTFAAYLITFLPALAVVFAMAVWDLAWVLTHHGQLPPGGIPPGGRVLNVALQVVLLVPGFVTAAVYVKTRPMAGKVPVR